jgi:two-component system chemotaxis response regulator CheB
MKKIKVLIVDDSLLFREALSMGLSSDPFDARDKIIYYEPDVMTCDVEMPKQKNLTVQLL